jgi:hypothetical protein
MAFPTNGASPAATFGTTASATPVINLPSTGIAAGDVLFVFVRVAVAGAIGWPGAAGVWNELFDASADGADDQFAGAWKLADGSENGTTITLSSGNGRFAALAYSIRGAIDPRVQPPELSTVATGTSANPDATTCTPTGGAKDYYWLTFTGREGEATITSRPTNFGGTPAHADSGTSGAVTANVTVSGGTRSPDLNAASVDAGQWVFTASDDWTAYTIAFHPGVPVTTAGRSDGIVKPAKHKAVRGWAVGTSLALLTFVPPPLPPGQQLHNTARRGPRVTVATQTLPPIALAAPVVQPMPQPRPAIHAPPRRGFRSWYTFELIPPDTLPPGQRSFGRVARSPVTIRVATQTLPAAAASVPLPPGVQSAVPPATHPSRRPWSVSPQPPVVAQAELPPGDQLQGRPPQRPPTRPWVVVVQPPTVEAIPPGQQLQGKPPQREHPRPWSVSTEQPRPIPPGVQIHNKGPRRKAVRPWSVSPEQPRPEPLPIGQVAVARATRPVRIRVTTTAELPVIDEFPPGQRHAQGIPAVHRRVRPWVQTQIPPVGVAEALPPGIQLQGRPPQRTRPVPWATRGFQLQDQNPLPVGQPLQGIPARHAVNRPWAIWRQLIDELSTLPPGVQVSVRPPQRQHPRPWSVSPEQPRPEALPVGDQVLATPAQRTHPRPWTLATRPPEPLPIGQQLQGRPAQRPPTRTWVFTLVPVVFEVYPPGQNTTAAPAHRVKRRPTTQIGPEQPRPDVRPPGQSAQGRPAQRPPARTTTVGFQPPIVEALPPGQTTVVRPPTRPARRTVATGVPPPIVEAFPPGRTTSGVVAQRPRTRGWSQSPAQPLAQIMPPGWRATTLLAQHPHRRWPKRLKQQQPPALVVVLPPTPSEPGHDRPHLGHPWGGSPHPHIGNPFG